MDEQTVNEAPLFEASDVSPVANDETTEQAESVDSSALRHFGDAPARCWIFKYVMYLCSADLSARYVSF